MPPSAPVQITEYVWPRATGEWLAGGGTLALYAAGLASRWVVPGSALWDLLAQYFPGGPDAFLWITRNVVFWLAAAHAAEVLLFDQLRLRRHGVPRWSALWFKWQLSVFIEGIGAWGRIGKVIAAKQGLKSK
ncbi:hypothetical protein LMH87_005284 [Akanthomyces muscarius]|uniref:Uncharacterized protein n=2 Tax=Akanthomyces TaxID=150366 RepID=A0A168KVW3_CORDF|nr:hypothetical protein LMH87_005284 [Akanthomyces muscarius]KAJ4163563.1 hypothetical protein LMH87_005284 [Akanthomyces muscarius]OAA82340.1 hypothetical protein LEL_01885 [Akanthomyces lecanii RCEF 1005]